MCDIELPFNLNLPVNCYFCTTSQHFVPKFRIKGIQIKVIYNYMIFSTYYIKFNPVRMSVRSGRTDRNYNSTSVNDN